MTSQEKNYIDDIKEKIEDGEFYYDNPGAAIDDIDWLVKLVEKLSETK